MSAPKVLDAKPYVSGQEGHVPKQNSQDSLNPNKVFNFQGEIPKISSRIVFRPKFICGFRFENPSLSRKNLDINKSYVSGYEGRLPAQDSQNSLDTNKVFNVWGEIPQNLVENRFQTQIYQPCPLEDPRLSVQPFVQFGDMPAPQCCMDLRCGGMKVCVERMHG